MKIALIGVSHATAPIALRERFAKATSDSDRALSTLCRLDGITEACLISTCNRVEFYIAGQGSAEALLAILHSHVQSLSGLTQAELDPHLYLHQEADAIRHLFRVASALDSMVLGEPQILGQVKTAFRRAEEAKTLGPVLRRVFQRAFHVAKRVRTETAVSENAVSMSFAAVELGRQIFEDLSDKKVLLIGAGKMANLAAKHLQAAGVSEVRVASRTLLTAEKLADEVGGVASSLSDLPWLLERADIVISSTAAPGYVVDRKMMHKIMRARRFRNILFVDIAVPRDIDPAIAKFDNVFVYDVDDLKSVLDRNQKERAKEATRAEAIVAEELDGYARWSRSQEVVPVIKALRAQVASIVEEEIERSLGRFSGSPQAEKHLRAMGSAMTNKFLHPVMQALKSESASGEGSVSLEALVQLFDLDLNPALNSTHATAEQPMVEGSNVLPFRPNRSARLG